MSYATKQNLVDRYSEAALLIVAALASDASQLDDDKIALAIGDAESLVNVHVRARYAVPLTPVPDEIVAVTCALARYGLYGNATNIPEAVQKGYDAAVAILKSIRDGDSALDCAAAPASSPAAIDQAPEFAGDDPVMTADKLRAW